MEILFRLIRDGKVVGEERHHGCIETGCIHIQHRTKKGDWADVVENPECYIPHDRKDLWTGLDDKNWRKIFERDIIQQGLEKSGCWFAPRTVKFINGSWMGVHSPNSTPIRIYVEQDAHDYEGNVSNNEWEVIGIEGVEYEIK